MTQDFMIRSGIQMSVVGADALIAALRQVQQETIALGAATGTTLAAANAAWATYAANRATALAPMQAVVGVADPMKAAASQVAAEGQRVADAIDESMSSASQAVEQNAQQITQTLTYLGVAFEAYGAKVGKMAIDTATLASRAEELDVVVRNMAETLGYNVQAIKEYEESIKDLNIRTDAARLSLLMFMRMGLDVSKAVTLSRVAQDAAVIAMEDSSEALEAIMRGIMTLQPRVLRTHGIVVNLDMAYKDYTHTMGTTVEALTMEEKQQIALNEVLKQGVRLQGMYESAMTTASKQMRSLHREAYETTRELGEGLVPGLTAGVKIAKLFNDTIQAAPDALQGTVSKMVALSAVMATVAGTGMLLIPRLQQLRNALAAINAIRLTAAGGFAGLGAALIPVAAIGIVATALAVWKSIREAQDKQSASAIDTAQSYGEYIVQLGKAKDANIDLTYEIWKNIEAQRAQGEAPTGTEVTVAIRQLQGEMSKLWPAMEGGTFFTEVLPKQFQYLDDLTLEYASNLGMVAKMLKETGRFQDPVVLQRMAIATNNMAKAEVKRRVAVAASIDADRRAFEHWTKRLDLYTEDTKRTMALAAATKELTAAMEGGIVTRYTDFLGGLADALGDIRGIDQDLADIRVENTKNIKKMGADMSKSMKEIADQLAKLVPGATEDEARKQMAGGAWDEWARRWAAAQDEVMSAEEAGWLAHTQDLVKGTKWMMLEGETTYEWLARLREGFYAGDKELTDRFANQQTAAWQWMKIQNAEKLKEKQAELGLEYAAKKKELDDELALEIAADKKKRQWAMVEQALALAGNALALENWAKDYAKRAGAPDMWKAFADPKQLFGLIQQGIIDLKNEPALQAVIDQYGTGLTQAMGNTKTAMDDNATAIANLNTEWGKLKSTLDIAPNYQPMQYKPGRGMPYVQGMGGPLGALTEGMAGFQGLAQDLIGKTFPAIANANLITIQDMKSQWTELEQWVYGVMYGHSIVPTLEQAMDDWARATKNAVDLEIIPAIKRVIDELAKIPTEIRVNITVSYGGWTGGGAGGALPPGPPPTGGVGGLVVPPGVGGLMVLPPLVGRGATRSSAPVMVSGDSFVINVNDPASMALAQMMVDDRKQQRRNTFMGA